MEGQAPKSYNVQKRSGREKFSKFKLPYDVCNVKFCFSTGFCFTGSLDNDYKAKR